MNFNEEIISALLVVPEQILGLLKICLFVNCQFPWFFNYQPSCSHSASGLEVWYGQWVPHNIGTFVTVISFNNTWPTSIFYPDSASSRWWILKWCCDVEAFLIMHAMSLWTIVSHGGYQTDEVPVFLFIWRVADLVMGIMHLTWVSSCWSCLGQCWSCLDRKKFYFTGQMNKIIAVCLVKMDCSIRYEPHNIHTKMDKTILTFLNCFQYNIPFLPSLCFITFKLHVGKFIVIYIENCKTKK